MNGIVSDYTFYEILTCASVEIVSEVEFEKVTLFEVNLFMSDFEEYIFFFYFKWKMSKNTSFIRVKILSILEYFN